MCFCGLRGMSLGGLKRKELSSVDSEVREKTALNAYLASLGRFRRFSGLKQANVKFMHNFGQSMCQRSPVLAF